jgi:hypothetical protein
MDENQIITVKCLYPASPASSKTQITSRYFVDNVWKTLRLNQLQKYVPPERSENCSSIDGLYEVPDDTTVILKYQPLSIARDGVYPFPCMPSKYYNALLPTLLKYFGQQWWSCNSHEDLRHFRTSASYDELYYAAIESNTSIQYDNMVSPCQQLVMSTLLCSQAFSVRLPLRLILNILTFLPQELFRGGDAVNCCPVEKDVDDIHNFNNF